MTNNEPNWTQIKVTVPTASLDAVCAIMTMLDPGLMIEDYSDIETGLNTVYGELIDERILKADRSHASVSLYLPCEKPLGESLAFLRERFAAAGIGDAQISTEGLDEEAWADSWKQYYKPIRIGERVIVSPPWEKREVPENGVLVEMDPGMAFGTGSHETTRLVLRLLEKYIRGGERVLDVGCGSGILSICASKLGARECAAYDIDPVAVRVARDNIRANGTKNVTCETSDLLASVDTAGGPYDLVTANIVAEIIERMAPDLPAYIRDGSLLIASGIVDEKQIEVVTTLGLCGFTMIDELHENGWCAIVMRR